MPTRRQSKLALIRSKLSLSIHQPMIHLNEYEKDIMARVGAGQTTLVIARELGVHPFIVEKTDAAIKNRIRSTIRAIKRAKENGELG